MNEPDRETLITAQLAALPLADKVRLLTGASSWRLHGAEAIGLRQLVVSDGPAGVRGVTDSESETGASFPSPTALAATWDVNLARRLGTAFAAEADRHGVDVVLGPVVNLQRTPVGGRHFECLSEDPLLSARLATVLVKTMQDNGIGACVKHFVANDSETARTEYVARIDERTLREVYLAPFEAVVREAGAWTVMAAYNGVDTGVESNSATEHHHLLTGILKEEWGFDGVVMSDWTAATSTAESANAGLDLVMPGPGGPWEDALLKAVQRGEVAEAVIDDKVRRILRLAHRRGALDGAETPATPRLDASPVLRELAARSIVVLKDDNRLLPRTTAELESLALIGPNAVDAFLQGGGSCFVRPDHVVTPQQGLRSALAESARMTVHRGGYARPHLPALDPALTTQPDTYDPGIAVEFADATGDVIETLRRDDFNGWVRHVVPESAATATLRTRVRLSEPGRHWLGVGTVGVHRIRVDGQLVASGVVEADGDVILNSSVNAPPSVDHPVDIEPGTARLVEIEAELQIIEAYGWGRFLRAALRHQRPGPSVDAEIADAVAAARRADLAVVIVGTNDQVESEGWDRPDLDLPGRQDELVRRVAEVNPNTIVVVNAGAPVLLPWLDEVGTVLWNWFPGQECGDALADVLFGRVEPSGRLPWTLPATPDDVPVPHAIPHEGIVDYTDALHIGYRAYARDGVTPAACFGHGLGWTDWEYRAATVTATADGGAEVAVTVANTGPRPGREVVQVYLSASGGPERPARWLAAFAVTDAEPGTETSARVRIDARSFQVWDTAAKDWTTPPGHYRLHIGRSIADTRLTLDLPR